ncbi:hypothetical protein [Roseibium limicola]|uniref:Uncharacterized protein n=1 Tax=Roseibium limicola TaxID=2816037 RepID=A0A939J9C4_9HYPH|nr:hypothetical protein [Roseibium limicola]MBO0345248.1 hypothetical protein [Roseibium limicola]
MKPSRTRIHTSSRSCKTSALALMLLGAAIVTGITPAAAQGLTLGELLFAPTPYAGRSIPSTYNTPYYCPTFKKGHSSGWKGIIGGRKYDFDNSYIVSGAGCFETQRACEAYLTGMDPYVNMISYKACEPF